LFGSQAAAHESLGAPVTPVALRRPRLRNWVKEAHRFSFVKSPQVSIAAIAALQLEPAPPFLLKAGLSFFGKAGRPPSLDATSFSRP
jgi:hypothetical protein